MTYNLYLSALLIAATCCTLAVAYLSWQRREIPIAISFGLSMFAGSIYAWGYAFEIVSTTLEQIRFWLRIEYIGVPFGGALWMIVILQYTERQSWIRKRMIALLMVIPVLTLVAHYTNEWHHLFYKSMTLNESEGFPLVTLVKGPLYMVHIAYVYTLFAIGVSFMIQMYRKATPRLKKQIAIMILGSCGPHGFYLIGVFYMPIDLSPFGFVFSGVCFMWGIYQFNMLRLAPFALQKVFESMQDAVIVLDLDNRLSNFNQSANRVIRDLNKKMVGLPASQVFVHYPALLEILMQDPSSHNRVRISVRDDERLYHVQMSFFRDNSQKPVGKMLLLSDVTETVSYEERLLDHARQLSELNTFKDKMFNVVAHDIRDPLAVLVNLMELLEEEMQECGEGHEEIVHEMGQQIQNTFTLVESLLDWFQTQRGGMVFNPVVRDLAHAVRMNMRFLKVRSEGKGIQIRSDIPQETFVFADKEMLDLIIRNLLSNAIKFTDYGGSIQLKAAHVDDRIIVSVSDTGVGVPIDQTNSLLQEDYPASSVGTGGERGVGLGLTLCREFVRLNGGEIWFESIPSLGSTFYFSIPAPSGTFAASIELNGRRDVV